MSLFFYIIIGHFYCFEGYDRRCVEGQPLSLQGWLFLHEFEVGDFIGIVVLGFDADDVGGGGEVGDVEVVGACEGGHGASVHVHDEDFKDFVGGADDGAP